MPRTTDPETRDALPLAGLRVIELDAIGPVPFTGMQLMALGADVIRIRPPRDRPIGLELDAEADLLNRGKPERRIDLKNEDGHAALHSELARADVLLEGFRPGVLERLDLAPAALLAKHPRLVIGRLSGWGEHGPLAARAGHDINFLALSGLLSTVGTAERPVVPNNLIADFGGGAMHLLAGVLAALVRRGINGRGGLVRTSLLAGSVALSPMLHGLLAAGRWQPGREVNILDGGLPFYRVYAARDARFVAVGALEAPFFGELLALLSLEGVIDPERQWDRGTWPAMAMAFERAFRAHDRDHWAQLAEPCDACVTPVLDLAEALRHRQLVENGLVADHPFARPATPWRFAE